MKRLTTNTLWLMLSLFVLASCGDATETTEAEVTEAAEEPATEMAGATTYVIDVDDSELGWSGEKKFVNWKHWGTINISEGTVTVEGDQIVGGEFVIDMNTLAVASEDMEGKGISDKRPKLEGHLKSDDFFNVEQYPTAVFKVTKVEPLAAADEDGNTHSVSGNLTIRDVTKNITFPATIEMEGDEIEVESEFHINRADFNVKYGSESFFDLARDEVIKDEIHFDLELVAARQAS